MIDDKTEKVLAEIFGRASGWDDTRGRFNEMYPGFADIAGFAKLLSQEEKREEDLQRFLEDHPQMLLGLFGQGGDSDHAFITKPPIGTQFKADYAILSNSQAGCALTLVELEPDGEELFTTEGTSRRRLQGAIGQVQNWAQWIQTNKTSFVRDTIDLTKRLPLFPEKHVNGSFRLTEADQIEDVWRLFGGLDNADIQYAIIIGRWSKMSEEHRKRLIFLNRQDGRLYTIYTYDQVARRAFDRPMLRPDDSL